MPENEAVITMKAMSGLNVISMKVSLSTANVIISVAKGLLRVRFFVTLRMTALLSFIVVHSRRDNPE